MDMHASAQPAPACVRYRIESCLVATIFHEPKKSKLRKLILAIDTTLIGKEILELHALASSELSPRNQDKIPRHLIIRHIIRCH